MSFRDLSIFCQRTFAIFGCAISVSLNAAPSARYALPGHVPSAVSRLKPVGTLAETNHLQLALGLPLRHQAELAALLHDLYDPSNAKFRQFLKPAEFADRFGPTEEDYAAVRGFAQAHGLRIVQTHANRVVLDVEGSIADVKDAFHVNMKVFKHPIENRTFYAPETEPTVEKNLPLLHVAGLDNYLLPKSNLRVRTTTQPANAVTGSGPNGNFIGHDFRAAYAPGVTVDGAGQTVALVEFDTFASRDIATYERMASLPNVPVTAVPIDGFSGPPDGGQSEVSLDIEMAISMAPGLSQVLVYEAPYGQTFVTDDLFNQIAIDDLANQISCSWYYEIDATTDFIFQEMAAQGQSFFNASGDYGAFYFDEVASFQPMGDPNITVVGGTTLTTSGSGGPWASETVWNWFSTSAGTAAGSGGISPIYGIPYWQQAVNMSSNQGSSTLRDTPDVALTADNVFVYSGNTGETVGGTSCAAPLWAGFTALINEQAAEMGRPPVGFLNPTIYALAQSPLYPSIFHDITKGNNTNYNGSTKFYAVPGYDLCTGWGTPTGQALINALAPPPDNLIVQARGGLSFAVANGYPLPSETQTLVLKSLVRHPIDWAFGPLPTWLGASVSHGVVSPGQAAFVTLAAADAATNLPPGDYATNLLLTNLNVGVTHLIPVFLNVFDPLLITPSSGMAVTGPAGGPFNVTEETISLTNFASVPMQWTAESSSPFIDLFPTSGTLEPFDSTNVIAALDPSASNILISSLTGDLVFTDLYTTNKQLLPFTLNIGNGGFETGDFSDWTLDGDGGSTNFVTGVPNFVGYIHSGEFSALLGEPYQTASLSETLPTVSNQIYQISLFLDNPVGGAENQFEVRWGGAILFNQVNVPPIPWTNMQFAVLATNSATTLDFISRNDPDYFGLDDISVTAMPPPTFSSGAIVGNALVFTWSAIPGASYQLKSSTDLSTWIKVGFPFKATNTVMTTKETLRISNHQQYYEVILEMQ